MIPERSDRSTPGTDRLLLLEVALVLTLVGVGILIYVRPAAEGFISPPWWHWIALGALFFATVGLHTFRRRRRSQAALHEAIREDAG